MKTSTYLGGQKKKKIIYFHSTGNLTQNSSRGSEQSNTTLKIAIPPPMNENRFAFRLAEVTVRGCGCSGFEVKHN